MNSEVIILVVDDDDGHAGLINKNLKRAGITNPMMHFKNGEEILNFLFKKGTGEKRADGKAYIILLDIRMPKINGVDVLKKIKEDSELKSIPIIMITTTDDQREIDQCHKLGCSCYITKPIEYDKFVNAIRQLGLFLTIVKVPVVKDNQ